MNAAFLTSILGAAKSAKSGLGSFLLSFAPLFAHGWKGVKGSFQSMSDAVTGAHLTGAQRESNAFEAEQAQKQMDFQERMSSTEYQRGIADMKAAGLNPALLYGNGANGATTPSGAMAGSESPGSPDVVGFMTALANLSLLKAERDNLRVDIDKKRQDINESKAREDESRSRTRMNDLVYRYYPALTTSQLNQAAAAINDLYASADLKKRSASNVDADTALKETANEIQKIEKDWLPRLNAAKEKGELAAAAASFASAAYDNYFVSYGKSHGGQLPGYNQALGIASAVIDFIAKVAGEDDDTLDIGKVIHNAIVDAVGHSGAR